MNQNFTMPNFSGLLGPLILIVIVLLIIGGLGAGLSYLIVLWLRNRGREAQSLESTLIQVTMPRENEIKIDAAEQFFASFAGIKVGGMFSFIKFKPHISFELVGMPEDIRFFVYAPNKYKDLVEKQINASYPDAEIKEVSEKTSKEGYIVGNEYNIFSREGKVAFASFKLADSNYKPVKVFKDFAVDPMSSLTSVLAKMSVGEGAAIQVIITGADSKWSKTGRKFIAATKKAESNPETAKYSADPKELEGIENKISKPGFYTIIRVVVSSSSQEAADAHLANIVSTIDQFSGINKFKKNKHWIKGNFISDFIYRYLPDRNMMILSSEELAGIFHFPNKSVATPHIHWLNAKRAPAPAQIPDSGMFLGTSTIRGITKPDYSQRDERRRHM